MAMLLCRHMTFPWCVHVERVVEGRESLSFSSYKATKPIRLEPNPYDLIELYLLKALFWRAIWEFWRNIIQSIATLDTNIPFHNIK